MTPVTLPTTAIDASWVSKRLGPELRGEVLIAQPMHEACRLAVVVPVYDETPRRIIAQLLSFLAQGVAHYMEIIYVVNNGPDDGTDDWKRAYARNQEVLSLPIFRNRGSSGGDATMQRIREGLAVYAIDRSTLPYQVPGNNVGIAHQRGLAEAALRFAQLGRNGLVLRTDADCRYEDSTFGERLLRLFDFNPGLVGIAGDYSLELEVDDPEAEGLAAKLEQHKLLRRYRDLYRDITSGVVCYEPHKALGRCIVHRAFEGIAVGGVKPVNYGEDVLLGRALETYAAAHGLRFDYGYKWSLGPVAAMRISERTGNDALRRSLARMSPDGSAPIVDDAFNPGTDVVLDDAYLQRLVAAVREMPGGQGHIEWLFITSALSQVRVR